MVLVSIIIVNYNAGFYLKQCIESIKTQTIKSFEIIIIDNHSTDTSLENIRLYDDIKIVCNPYNFGFAMGQNQGIRLASGKYILALNFDIIMERTFLEEMVSVMKLSENVGTVSGKMLRLKNGPQNIHEIDNVGLLLPSRRVPKHRGQGEMDTGQHNDVVKVFGAMGAAALYRREMLEDIVYQGQYFDETYFMWYEDIDLDWRARLRGWDCIYHPKAVVYHVGDVHGHGKSKLGARVSMRNRWRTILSNECFHCLVRNSLLLIKEELALLRHVVKFGLFKEYTWAVTSLLYSLPYTIKKRHWVRSQAKYRCLPDFPITYEKENLSHDG
jgi:GT2 family glycosyltransferase